ncbi:hypothetical protein HHI36_004448 [Cryptolaemus montrouzieri]|uniref:Phospholipid/glycerol acyltransferase domain-containing protein n=1 Tax=Cryptolaemus montrouzieri TaxID=559131 RepID=A0ABD2NRJ3_9CUCU
MGSIEIKPFNVHLFRSINYYLVYGLYGQLAFLAERWASIEIIIYADKQQYDKYFGKEHAFSISNHTYEIDWFLVPLLTENLKLLGNYKCFAKKALRFAPALGWVLSLSENVFLERSFEKDRIEIQRQVTRLLDYKSPMWLHMYPEGTRFTPTKHKASIEFAKEKNLEQLKHHLQPRTKGFVTSLPPMKGKIPAIYDFLVAFKTDNPEDHKPTIINLIQGKSLTCHIFIDRIPLESIPDNESEQEQFIRDLFIKKDKMKESFIQTGDFFKLSEVKDTNHSKRKNYLPSIEPNILVSKYTLSYDLLLSNEFTLWRIKIRFYKYRIFSSILHNYKQNYCNV